MTISLHESGRYLFPGTGFPDEIGTGDARGTSLNVPLPPSTNGAAWLPAFDAIVPPAIDAFDPDVLVTQLGCDTHVTDPLAHLALTTDDYVAIAQRFHVLAHEQAGGRWVALGGGGYQIGNVVPRAWTIYFAELSGQELPHEVPWNWLGRCEQAVGERPPETFLEGSARLSSDRSEQLRREISATVEELKRQTFDLLERMT
jgi:acetoin utilization protein AcuC